MIQNNSPVTIVTVKRKIPLYKGDEQANAIELIELEELGYELVAGKNLYEVGDKAVLIQPDYCLSDIPLFESFIRPIDRNTGLPNESKSMLGKVGGEPRRIRAKKFTLSKEPNGDPVYSNGVLLPWNEVENYIKKKDKNPATLNLYIFDLTEKLGITKYEEPEPVSKSGLRSGQTEGRFPEGMYKTDEENINNLWNHIDKKIGYPIRLVGTIKADGSSVTFGFTPKFPDGLVCSRNLRKKLMINKVTGRRNKTWWEYLMFWKNHDLNLYTKMQNPDDFVIYTKPFLDKMSEKGAKNIVFRGELNGGSMKGSGNKNNPSSKLPVNIKIFGADVINENGIAEKLPYDIFKGNVEYYGFDAVDEVFNKEFNSKEELVKECNDYFKDNLIEGIVVRTLDSKFSAKIMSLEYDSKK